MLTQILRRLILVLLILMAFSAVCWSGDFMLTSYGSPLHLLIFGTGIVMILVSLVFIVRD